MLADFQTMPRATVRRASARSLHQSLLQQDCVESGRVGDACRASSRDFLVDQLNIAAGLEVDFPADPRLLPEWLASRHATVAAGYRSYLDERQAGAERRFFGSRAHALHFIRAVAPTKLVDGAWLYGLLPRWQDPRLAPLVRTYLEELGDGMAARNHVLLYRRLLARHGCERWQDQPDALFVQGAVQLALGQHGAEFLPEVIGFNLGYEQLPLHLPITAHELGELGIDPYYFTLHVTIDNASTGHAQMALQTVLEFMPRFDDPADFYRRVGNGYRLNDVGAGTMDVIGGFDLDREVEAVFEAKAAVGALLHSDRCRVAGRSLTDWLRTPGQVPALLQALQAIGWIQRGKAPEHSRFWRLLTDAQAPMFGVFDAFEQQLIRDWIVDDADVPPAPRSASGMQLPTPRARAASGAASVDAHAGPAPLRYDASVSRVIASHIDDATRTDDDADVRRLADRLGAIDSKPEALAALRGLLSPASHWTPAGLLATRIYADLVVR